MAKYNKGLVAQLCNYIKEGDSQKIAARKCGITEETFYKWLREKIEFSDAVKRAKSEFNATITGKLEASLWRRAMGYEVTETETEYEAGTDEAGNSIPVIKKQKTKVKHIAPDTGALIFALTNVAPDRWVNKQKVETQKVEEAQGGEHQYQFEDLPEEMLFALADQMQAAEFERRQGAKDGAK